MLLSKNSARIEWHKIVQTHCIPVHTHVKHELSDGWVITFDSCFYRQRDRRTMKSRKHLCAHGQLVPLFRGILNCWLFKINLLAWQRIAHVRLAALWSAFIIACFLCFLLLFAFCFAQYHEGLITTGPTRDRVCTPH